MKTSVETDEQTPGGIPLVKIEYEDGLVEFFSKLMFDQIVSDKSCSLEKLREKRCEPIVLSVQSILREWGIKAGELAYFSALLNNSLEYNRNAAVCKLWGDWMPVPLDPDEVTLTTIDRVLKNGPAIKGK